MVKEFDFFENGSSEYQKCAEIHKLLMECMNINKVDASIGVGVMLTIVAQAHKHSGFSRDKFIENSTRVWDSQFGTGDEEK